MGQHITALRLLCPNFFQKRGFTFFTQSHNYEYFTLKRFKEFLLEHLSQFGCTDFAIGYNQEPLDG